MKVKCPQCGKLTKYEGNKVRPFCSDRCKIIDLGDWASGKYALPIEDTTSDVNFNLEKQHNDEDAAD